MRTVYLNGLRNLCGSKKGTFSLLSLAMLAAGLFTHAVTGMEAVAGIGAIATALFASAAATDMQAIRSGVGGSSNE